MNKIDNNTVAIVFIGIVAVVGVWSQQTEIVTGAVGALSGFMTSKAISMIDNNKEE